MKVNQTKHAKFGKEILGNPNYQAICYGGYRQNTRNIQPTVDEIKEDMKILYAIGIRLLRTYNVHFDEAENVLRAITELNSEDGDFEMYVMLGAWIDCKNAWTEDIPDHSMESKRNSIEIAKVVQLANKYPDIVKMIAVGNESMVKWAEAYYVHPSIILKWVNYLQNLKKKGKLYKDLLITSSDNFASWGGGSSDYHIEDLNQLIKAVDFISMHTYPMHDTHYNPDFWRTSDDEDELTDMEKINTAMFRARDYAISQYQSVVNYLQKIKVEKPIHIGETGWASYSNEHYGNPGSRATDEYKAGLYYQLMMDWAKNAEVTCFYFEAFDEYWKNASNSESSENHFGLINLKSQVKFGLWDLVDNDVFFGLSRNGKPLTKTYGGNKILLLNDVNLPPREIKSKIKINNE